MPTPSCQPRAPKPLCHHLILMLMHQVPITVLTCQPHTPAHFAILPSKASIPTSCLSNLTATSLSRRGQDKLDRIEELREYGEDKDPVLFLPLPLGTLSQVPAVQKNPGQQGPLGEDNPHSPQNIPGEIHRGERII